MSNVHIKILKQPDMGIEARESEEFVLINLKFEEMQSSLYKLQKHNTEIK